MNRKDKAPEMQGAGTGANIVIEYKGKNISLSPLQYAVYTLLIRGRYSSFELMQHSKTSDPRKEIQYLRDKGIDVADRWINRQEIGGKIYPRHKEYFITSTDAAPRSRQHTLNL